MKYIEYILITIGLCFCLNRVKGEEGSSLFRHYQVENGLSDNMATCCVQDQDGYIWIGTRDGLNRFDGYSFKVFRYDPEEEDTPGSNWITSLGCDRQGHLWVGTLSGLYRYDKGRETFHHLPFTADKAIGSFQFDADNRLWVLMDGNLIRYNLDDKHFRIFSADRNSDYTSFCITRDDCLWAGGSDGRLHRLDPESGQADTYDLFSHSTPSTPRKLSMLYPSSTSDRLYVAFEHDDVKIFDTSTHQYYDLGLQQLNRMTILINCFLEKEKDELWIGTDSGLFLYNIATGDCQRIRQDPLEPYSLSSHFISALHQDRERGVWICFHQNGVNYYSPFRPFHVYYPQEGSGGMRGEVVRDICSDTYGNIWIGTEDAGINCLDREGNITNYQPRPAGGGLSHTNIRGLAASGDRLWIGHVIHGIDLMDIKSRKVVKHYRLLKDSLTVKNSTVRCIKVLQEGQVYVGTDDGIYRYDFLNDRFVYAPQFPPFAVNCIYEDRLGRIWAGMFNRAFYYNPVSNTGMYLPFDKLNTQRHNFVNDAVEDKAGNMWFATVEGVIKYDFQTGESLHYTVKNGMPSNVAFRILPDEAGNLWISTANGLVRLAMATGRITTYTEAHGLITRQFNDNAAFKDPDGIFYFGSVEGFVRFRPDRVTPDFSPLHVHLSSLDIQDGTGKRHIIDNASASSGERIVLTHQQSTFSISFSALNFIAPNSIRYAYRMGNGDNEWISIGDRNTVYLTELHPGSYLFEVRASILSGTWSEPTRLHIRVLPPWWLSPWAYTFYIIGALVVVGLLFGLWRGKAKRAMAYNMRLFEDQKEKELYQAKIDFFIHVAHEIRTPLTLIKNPLERLLRTSEGGEQAEESLRLMDKNVSRLLLLVNQLLDFRKTEIEGFRLNFVRTEVASFLSDIAHRFQETAAAAHLSLNLDFSVEELYAPVDREAFTKICSNLLTNAVKYAASRIVVRLYPAADGERFIIDFANDGKLIPVESREKIFEPFFRLDAHVNEKPGTGLGLPLARSLAEMHHGTLLLTTDADGLTLFRLTLPLRQADSVVQVEETAPSAAADGKHWKVLEGHPSILIVEDNSEMATFVAEEVNRFYNVATAANGAEALEILHRESFQLVVSDVMMPVMDGFELLKRMKSDWEFSHIPVILLTAKSTMQAHLEGLELGADAYLEKPFSTDLLLAQVANLLANRDHIRQFYFNSPIANLKSMAYSKADEQFLDRLNELIEANLSDLTLDVNRLADLMHLSRPTLYRKIRAISDLTPNELIRVSRLKRAAQLLLEGKLRIYEIAEQTGFSSQSYFCAAFQKQFGCSPSAFVKEHQEKKG